MTTDYNSDKVWVIPKIFFVHSIFSPNLKLVSGNFSFLNTFEPNSLCKIPIFIFKPVEK